MKLTINNNNNNQESANVQSAQVNNGQTGAVIIGGVKVAEVEHHDIEEAVIIEETQSTQSNRKAPKKYAKSEDPKFCLVTYTTKKGGTACYIAGFASEADAKAMADQLPHSISNSYRYSDKGEKVYVLSFGTRYVDAATALCHALNNGDQKDIHKYIADCHEIYNAVVSSAKAEREKKTQERKAERAKAKADELEAIKKKNGLYSMDEIAVMMKRVLAGEKVPELEAVKEALKAV